MPDTDNEVGPPARGSRMVVLAMGTVAVLLALTALVAAVAGFFWLGETGPPTNVVWPVAAGLVLGLLSAWTGSLLLVGGALLLSRVDELLDLSRSSSRGSSGGSAGWTATGEMSLLEQILQNTRDLRDIALLSEHERTLRVQVERAALLEQLEREVPALLREHEWQEARRRVEQARLRFPSFSAWDVLAEQVEEARAKFEQHEVETATREINDLATLGAWDRAAAVAYDLQRRHPRSEQVAALVRRVEAGLNKAGAEERARLMARAQEATNRRDWNEALQLVEQIIGRFPTSAEAHDLRLQLPTLRMNAEIQTRQRLEAEIREYVRREQFDDALRLAREVMTRYPGSPQAAALREQLPRLEQRAAQARRRTGSGARRS